MKILKRILEFFGYGVPRVLSSNHNQSIKTREDLDVALMAKPILTEYNQPQTYPFGLKKISPIKPKFKGDICRTDKGVLENYFFDYAHTILGGKLKNDISISLFDGSITPDFAYIDTEKNKFVVIEIDEPYTINDENELFPIHFKGADDARNKILLTNGWDIIRFSEEHIAKHTYYCVTYIKNFVEDNPIESENEIPCWSFSDAKKMITDSHRNTYLPYAFQNVKASLGSTFRFFWIISIKAISDKQSGQEYALLELAGQMTRLGKNEFKWHDRYQCWMAKSEFIDIMRETTFENLPLSTFIRFDKNYFYFHSEEISLRLESLGKVNGEYFNLVTKPNFRIKVPVDFIEVFHRYKKNPLNKVSAEFNIYSYHIQKFEDEVRAKHPQLTGPQLASKFFELYFSKKI